MSAKAKDASLEEILGAMGGTIDPVPVHPLYRLGLVFVAIAMVLLPLVYVGLIFLVGYGLKLYVENAWVLLSGWRRHRIVLLLFVTPLVAGVILVLFMIKPLFARRPRAEQPLTLDPAREDALFTFVRRVCGVVGSPMPREIRVDCQVNASASFRRGAFSLFGSDLVLTVGLPLAAALNVREFAGVLAHEFGHFAQGTAMRLTYVIRRVNGWFARVVYERDSWDVALKQWASGTDLRIGVMLHVSRLFVWLTRKILRVLMLAGHGISCFMLRQMEFDADRYSARVSGSETFEATARRLQHLNVAASGAFGLLEHTWQEGRLADDLPRLIEQHVARIPAEVQIRIGEAIQGGRTGFFDTHPSDRDRIARARREQTDGIFRLQYPATLLFDDFEALSKRATRRHYDEVLEDAADRVVLVSNASLLEGTRQVRANHESLQRFLQVPLLNTRPMWLPVELRCEGDWKVAYDDLHRARSAMVEHRPEVSKAIEHYSGASADELLARQAKNLIHCGLRLDPQRFKQIESSADSADAAIAAAVRRQRELAPPIDEYLGKARERLTSALCLLEHPQVVERIHDSSELIGFVPRMLETLTALQETFDAYIVLRGNLIEQMDLLEKLEGNESNDRLTGAILACSWELRERLLELRKRLLARYPFDHARGAIPLNEYLIPEEIVEREQVGPIANQAQGAVQRYEETYLRSLGSLTGIAERVEGALGMRPLSAASGVGS